MAAFEFPKYWLNRTRFLGHKAMTCRHEHGGKFVLVTQGVWAEVAVLIDQPLGVVAGDEVADSLAGVLNGVEDTTMDDPLLQGAECAGSQSPVDGATMARFNASPGLCAVSGERHGFERAANAPFVDMPEPFRALQAKILCQRRRDRVAMADRAAGHEAPVHLLQSL